MKTPFGPPLNPTKFIEYVKNNTPQEMIRDSINWECDPTDILTIADLVVDFLENDEYAIPLYYYALEILKNNPNLISPDTNIQGAYASLGASLINVKKYSEAIEALQVAYDFAKDDPTVKYNLAIAYFRLNDFQNSYKYITELFNKIPDDKLRERWPSAYYERARNLYNELIRILNKME